MKDKETSSVLIIEDEKGKKVECDVLLIITPKDSKKSYIAYTDNTTDESGAKRIYANMYFETNPKELLPIETEEEWCTIESILRKAEEESKKE